MRVNPTPPIDPLHKVEGATVPVGTARLAGGLGAANAAALATLLGGSGAVDLSPMARTAATLVAFGFPVVEIGPEPQGTTILAEPPAQPSPDHLAPAAAPHAGAHAFAQALAGALSLRGADAAEGWLPPQAEAQASAEAAADPAARGDAAAPRQAPAQQPSSAGPLLNAMLSAALTGQTALEVQRADYRPVRMELQREADGHGGFRITRVRIRHQTDDGVIDVTAEMVLSAAFQGEHAPMSVDVSSSGALADEVAAQLDALREALQARGLAPTVRAQAAD